MKLTQRISCSMLALTCALLMSTTVAKGAVPTQGDLFFTTFTPVGGFNVFRVHFVFDGTAITYSGATGIALLTGADGLIFNPNNGNLLIGEQSNNLVGQITTSGATVSSVMASAGDDPQAYNLVATPDKSTLLALPNISLIFPPSVSLGGDHIDVLPLTPSLGAGTAHKITGDDSFLSSVAFVNGKAYYGTALDRTTTGNLGILDLTTFTTTQITIMGGSQGALPTHALMADPFVPNTLIISGSNQIWQLQLDAAGTTATVISQISTATPTTPASNWDQTSLDGFGHMFAANNNGDILFVDYSATGLISAPGDFQNEQFLANDLDDIAPGGGVDGRMTGGGSVFEADGTRVTHGFELHCDVEDVPNRLEINWAGHRFHLELLTSAFCFKDPTINAGHPTDVFNTYVGNGNGLLDGAPGATASWIFTDAGEPGTNDMATITIEDSFGNVVLFVSGKLDSGNQQAHTDNK